MSNNPIYIYHINIPIHSWNNVKPWLPNSGDESNHDVYLEDMGVDTLDGNFTYRCSNCLPTTLIAATIYYLEDIVHIFRPFKLLSLRLTPRYISYGATLSLLNLN